MVLWSILPDRAIGFDMTTHQRDPKLYRDNVGLALFSGAGNVFVGRRINGRGAYQWQMPQGGVDLDEAPADAVLREMEEEIGVSAKFVDVLDQTDDWLYYDFPLALRKRMGGPFLGQRQKWFALRFKGTDSEVRLDKHKPEFDVWRWARLEDVPGLVVPFKRPVYEAVAKQFAPWSDRLAANGANPAPR